MALLVDSPGKSKYTEGSEAQSERITEEPILVFFSPTPKHSPASCTPFSLKQLDVYTGGDGSYLLKTRITLHLTEHRPARSTGGAHAFRHQPGRCRKVSKRDVRWGQSIRTRCKLCFVTSLLPSALSLDRGL